MRRIAVVILALVASLFAPLGSSPAASAEEPYLVYSSTTAFTTSSDPVAGGTFKIVGQVFWAFAGNEPFVVPTAKVILERKDTISGPWIEIGRSETAETTLPNGEKHIMYSFTRVARRTAWYRVRYESPNAEAITPSASDDGAAVPVLVRVHRNMPIRLQQPRPGRIFLAGVVRPEYARQRVVVLRKACGTCAWRTFARPLTDGSGRYRTQLSIPRRRSHFFIARARASRGFALSYSQRVRIRAG